MTVPGNSPRLLKGALVTVNLPDPTPTVVAFQYNPSTLTRTLQPRATGEGTSRIDVPRFRGAPMETLSLEIELDVTEALERGELNAVQMGLHGQLAAFECLLYPPSQAVIVNQTQLSQGILEIVPPPAPLALFVFGPRRIMPVRLTEFRITEEMHDANLNPLQARVTLGLQVLTSDDLPPAHKGSAVSMAHQVAKEVMANQTAIHNLNAVTGTNIRIL